MKSSLPFIIVPLKSLSEMTPKGISVWESKYSVKESIDRVQQFLQAHGATIYSRIDQQSEMGRAGLVSPPLEFLMFGNPQAGGPMMLADPLAALDLPLKIIAWEDSSKAVWVAYNDATFISDRYSLPKEISGPLELGPIISKALA